MDRKNIILSLAVAVAIGSMSFSAQAASLVPGEKSTLYYKIGGGESLSGAANPAVTNVKIGLGGTAKLNYTCGKFDASVTIANLMNSFSTLGTTVTAAVKAGIAALPLYILQRASPGLYELFQTYQKKAEAMWDLNLQSCQQMEAEIRAGGDPYEKWIKLATAEDWKDVSLSTTDVVQAKTTVQTNAGVNGLTWIGGVKKGGKFQPAIEAVRDITYAGYNTTLNQPVAASPATVYPPTTKLAETFPNAIQAADWAVSVIGDQQLALCSEVGCPAKASVPGTGLLPKFETERPLALTQLTTVVSATGAPARADLEKASAPGVVITRELVDALRAMRPVERQIGMERIAMEVAQARIIDRALMIRNLLLTGGGAPEAGFEPAQDEIKARVAQLNRYIDDLLFETRVRREVVSATATALLDSYRADRLQSLGTATQEKADKRPLDGGRVQ